jgi:uncharacterized protein VirK/YbjX
MRDWYGDGNPALSEAFASRPSLVAFVTRPDINLHWDAARRLTALEDHYRELAGRAEILRRATRMPLRMATVMADETAVEIVVDSPAWFMHEGETSINLFCGEERL